MDERNTSLMRGALRGGVFSRGKLGHLDASIVELVISASGDVAMVVDSEGVICDMALTSNEMARDGVGAWLDQRWSDTVTVECKHKVEELLRDARQDGRTQWREINQVTPIVNSMMVKFIAVSILQDDAVIAIGRDDRVASVLQQRLLEAQQETERDYAKLRDAEARYSTLFQTSGEGILIIEANSKKIIDLNPLAETILNAERGALLGENFLRIFDSESQDHTSSLLVLAQSSSLGGCPSAQLIKNGKLVQVNAVIFRQLRSTYFLIRISPVESNNNLLLNPRARLSTLIDIFPESFIITDRNLKIIDINLSSLDLLRVATKQQVIGRDLAHFIGRTGIDRDFIIDSLRDHGTLSRYSSILRTSYDRQEDVEISGISSVEGDEAHFGFTIRITRRSDNDSSRPVSIHRHSIEQLTDLVGRVKLKELVRESTDLIENLAIQAALELTNDNRASAAEVLGLSRQSLYSKMRRFGLGNLPDGEP